MTRKELIRLAREAGLDIPEDNPAYNLEFNLEELGVFAKLVTAEQQSWVASLEQNARDADRMYKELETELAASQAREKILREALEDFKIYAQDTGQPLYIYRRITDALSTPHDDSALREIKAGYEAHIKALRDALENCRLFAARRRAEEWATHILRFCESGGSVANPLRQDDSALRELLKAEREKCAKVIERLISGDGICADDGVWIHDCAEAIRAMGSE